MTYQNRHVGRPRVKKEIGEPNTEVQQDLAETTNINAIMAKYQKTGLIEHVNQHQGQYGDFTTVQNDFQSNLNQIMEAEDMFMSLPSNIREDFANNPAKFLEFATNPDNEAGMRKYGLLPPILKTEPDQPPVERAPKPSSKSTQKEPKNTE